jgi:hypothetical protein
MKKVATFVSSIRVTSLLCCSAAVLLSACGAGSNMGDSQQAQTAAMTYSVDTAGAPITGADDSTVAAADTSGAVAAPEAVASTTGNAGTESAAAPADGSTRLLAMVSVGNAAPATDTSASTATTATALMTAAPTVSAAYVVPTSTKNLYVATTGSDSNPGTQLKPVKTIARATALASAGYVIHVAPGTYTVSAPSTGSAGILTSKSGTSSAHITYVSDVKNGAKLVMTGTGILWDSKGNYVDILGFDISGSGRIGILAEGGNMKLNYNYIHDLTVSGGCNGGGGGAIVSTGSVGNVVMDSNLVKNIGYQWVAAGTCNTVQGLYISNANNIITNNVVSGVAAVAIQQWHGATASTIVNNTVFHSKMGILIGQGDGGATTGSANNYVANNIVYDNKYYGIIESGKVGGNNRYVNNLVASSGTNWKVKGSVSGSISSNPLFVNYQANGSGNYRLSSSSPAIDRGTATLAPKIDIAGVARPRGAAFDIGAYEY